MKLCYSSAAGKCFWLTELKREHKLISVYDVDAIIGLDQLSIPVPTSRDIAWEDLTVKGDGLTQQHFHILQVLVDLQWFH